MLFEKMNNHIQVSIPEGYDLNTFDNLEFYIEQSISRKIQFCYTPIVISATNFYVDIPKNDAMQLKSGKIKLQLAYTDEDGYSHASEPLIIECQELLKEEGYGDST